MKYFDGKPTSFSRAVLTRFMTEQEISDLEKKYIENKMTNKLKDNFCPNCGIELKQIYKKRT